METYTHPQPFVDYPGFQTDRQFALDCLDVTLIDAPLVGLIDALNTLPFLYTLQCCHGHFLTTNGEDISDSDFWETSQSIEYRLAYIAFCIESSPQGKEVAEKLKCIPRQVNRNLVQFCSAQWFWNQWVNSYALQVMPTRFKDRDSAVMDYYEAKEVKQARDIFFAFLQNFTSETLEQNHG